MSVYSILKSFCAYKTNKSNQNKSKCADVKGIQFNRSPTKYLNFKSRYKCNSSSCLREIKYNQ